MPGTGPMHDEPPGRRVLAGGNSTEVAFPDRACIHHLIGEQATLRPDGVAAVLEGKSLTYGVLEARANQLAHHLGSKGLGPDSIVALASRPSFEMLVGLLGILRCGAAYVPLDPDQPALERHLASLRGYRTNGFAREDSVRTLVERRRSRHCEVFGYGRFASSCFAASPPPS